MTKKHLWTGLLAIALVFGMTVVGCDSGSTDSGGQQNVPQTVTYQSAGGDGNTYVLTITENTSRAAYTPQTGDSYVLTIKKQGQPDKISRGTVTDKPDGKLKLKPDNSDVTFTVTTSGAGITEIEGSIAIEGGGEPVTPPNLFTPDTVITFSGASANGSSTQTTTQLTLSFSQAVAGLSDADITLTGVSGVTKGTLGGTGPTYTLPISGFSAGGTLSVAVSKTGYNISGSPKTVTIFYYSGGGGEVPPENKPVKDRWWAWKTDDSTATVNCSVADDGVNTITVGGTAMPNDWERWKASACYRYTGLAGKNYVYTFEAWTQSGDRDLEIGYVQYDEDPYLLRITDTRQTYNVIGGVIEWNGIHSVTFNCADRLGTFYVKVLEIKAGTYGVQDNLIYDEKADSITIIGYNITDNIPKSVAIPAQIKGKPVTVIGNGAFGGQTFITSVSIPNTVTIIEPCAFQNSNYLTGITIPGAVTSIGWNAFAGCVKLTSVIFAGANTDVDYRAFNGDLRDKYLAGGIGTYKTTAPVGEDSVWTKQ